MNIIRLYFYNSLVRVLVNIFLQVHVPVHVKKTSTSIPRTHFPVQYSRTFLILGAYKNIQIQFKI